MIFIVCWSCGYCTSIKGDGVEKIKAARRLKEEHEHEGSDGEIIRKGDLE